MDRGKAGHSRSVEDGDAVETTAAGVSPSRRLDRAHVAAIIQQVPSEAYTLAMRRLDPRTGRMRWLRGVVADPDGHEVLAAIDAGEACLRLHDIDDLVRHFDTTLPPGPIAAAHHRIRHGLIVASPRTRITLPDAAGEGMVRILSGSAALSPAPSEAIGTRREEIVSLPAGRALPWRPGVPTTLETGAETLVALTYEVVRVRRFAGLQAGIAAVLRAIAARRGDPPDRRDAIATRRGPAIDFRLTRLRPPPRVPS
jgi:hypothetical protein